MRRDIPEARGDKGVTRREQVVRDQQRDPVLDVAASRLDFDVLESPAFENGRRQSLSVRVDVGKHEAIAQLAARFAQVCARLADHGNRHRFDRDEGSAGAVSSENALPRTRRREREEKRALGTDRRADRVRRIVP